MHRYLFPGLEAGPEVMAGLLRLVPADRLNIPTHPDRFTPLEVVAHLADWEPILRDERLRLAAENPGGTFAAYDEGERAITQNYASQTMEQAVAVFSAERAKTIEFLKGLPHDKWMNSVVHPESGPLTLYDIANMMLGHDLYHAAQLMTAIR